MTLVERFIARMGRKRIRKQKLIALAWNVNRTTDAICRKYISWTAHSPWLDAVTLFVPGYVWTKAQIESNNKWRVFARFPCHLLSQRIILFLLILPFICATYTACQACTYRICLQLALILFAARLISLYFFLFAGNFKKRKLCLLHYIEVSFNLHNILIPKKKCFRQKSQFIQNNTYFLKFLRSDSVAI